MQKTKPRRDLTAHPLEMFQNPVPALSVLFRSVPLRRAALRQPDGNGRLSPVATEYFAARRIDHRLQKLSQPLQDSNLGPIGYEPTPKSVQRFAAAAKSSFSLGTEGPTQSNPSQRNGEIRKKFVPYLSPTFRGITVGADHLLSVREAAARLGVSIATVYTLCQRSELPHVRVSNAIRIAPADLVDFIARGRHR